MSTSNKDINFDFHAVITTDILNETHNLTADYYKSYQDYYNLLLRTQEYPYLTYDQKAIRCMVPE